MALELFREGVWSTPRPARFFGVETRTRMTLVKLSSGGLFIHSPVALDAATRTELGDVQALIERCGREALQSAYEWL